MTKASWLRSEIEKLEGAEDMLIKHLKEMFRFLLENEDGTSALTSIITRYKEELKVLESK